MTTQPPEGFPSLAEALGSAAVEVGFVDDVDEDLFEAEQPAETAPEAGEQEQAQQEEASPDETDQPVFGELLEEEEEQAQPKDIWDTEVELEGFEHPVKLAELRDGHLRQADYTRKTQALADERRQFEEEHGQALRLMKALSDDPAGTAAYLAVQTGVVEEQAVADKVRRLQDEWKPPPSRAEIEAQVEKRIAEEVEKHPAVMKAREQALLYSIEQDFARIEQKHQVKLTDRDKEAILKKAIDSGTADLDLVTESMLRRLDKVRQDREQARGAAGQRPTVRSPSADTPAKVETVEDALNLALSQVRGGE